MEPVTTAILAALAGSAGKKMFDESYDALKNLFRKKFGHDCEVVQAIDKLEAKPESNGRQETLNEEVIAVKAQDDPEIVQAAEKLLEKIKASPGGEQHIQTAIGSYIAQADRGGKATVNVNRSRD